MKRKGFLIGSAGQYRIPCQSGSSHNTLLHCAGVPITLSKQRFQDVRYARIPDFKNPANYICPENCGLMPRAIRLEAGPIL
jgi:hypothetical protein